MFGQSMIPEIIRNKTLALLCDFVHSVLAFLVTFTGWDRSQRLALVCLSAGHGGILMGVPA